MSEGIVQEMVEIGRPETSDLPWAVRHRWIVLGLLVFAQAAVGAFFNPLENNRNPDFAVYAILGIILVQPILFAIWAVFAPQRYFTRFLWAFFLNTMIAFAIEMGGYWKSARDAGTIMAFNAIVFFASIFILSIVRRFSGWKLRSVEEGEITGNYLAHQFGIKHILLLTAITALALSLYRSLAVLCPNLKLPEVGEACRISVELLLMFFPVVFIPWFVLIRHRNLLRSIQASIIFLGIIEAAVYFIIPMMEKTNHMPLIILSIQFSASISLLASALTLRWCGFRLVRL